MKYQKGRRAMARKWTIGRVLVVSITTAGLSVLVAGSAAAHCDTTRGPIVPEARAALESGDVTPVLKWVKRGDEAEIRAAFTSAIAVRTKGPEAKELADRYFLETLVRVHRAGEGAPYSGIKDGPVDPVVAMADEALADRSADEMIEKISRHMAAAIRARFSTVLEAAKTKDASVEAGREYVAAYVAYTHYVEGVHTRIAATAADHAHADGGVGGSVHPH